MLASKRKILLCFLVILQLCLGLDASPFPSDEALRRAARAMEANDFQTAVVNFEQALKQDPQNVSIISSLGLCLAGLGRFGKAARQFRALTKLQPQVPGHHYNLGLALLRVADSESAEKAFRQVLRLAPGHRRVRTQLANSLLDQARAGNASKMRAAAEVYRQAVSENPLDPELRFNFAFTLARTGDEVGAQSEYREVLRLKPDFPHAQYFLGITLFRLGNWDASVESLQDARMRGQNDFFLHYYLGSALLKKGDRNIAARHLHRAVELNPQHPGVHFQLGTLYRALGESARATAEQHLFRELTAREEVEWRAHTLKTAAAAALEKGDLTHGISALRQAYEAHPDASSARNLALTHLQEGNVAEARTLLQKALRLAPRDAAARNYFGLLEAREGNLSLAEGHFEKAAKLDPSFADALYNAGIAASRLGKYDTAVEHLENALEASDIPRIREALAMVLMEAGRDEEAQRHFEAAQNQRILDGANP